MPVGPAPGGRELALGGRVARGALVAAVVDLGAAIAFQGRTPGHTVRRWAAALAC